VKTATTPRAPTAPKHVAEVAAFARRHGWTAAVAWDPADEGNTGDGFVVSLSGDTARGRGEFRLVWRLRGASFAFQRYFSSGREPGGTFQYDTTLAAVRSAVRNSPIPVPGHPAPARSWRAADALPVTVDDLTERMLAPVQRIADSSWLPQTVWPSRFVGRDHQGGAALVVSMATPREWERPADAAEGSEPLLTILPASYFPSAAPRG